MGCAQNNGNLNTKQNQPYNSIYMVRKKVELYNYPVELQQARTYHCTLQTSIDVFSPFP